MMETQACPKLSMNGDSLTNLAQGSLRPGRTPHHKVFVQPYLQRNSSLYFYFFPEQVGAGFLSYQVYLWLPTGQRQ